MLVDALVLVGDGVEELSVPQQLGGSLGHWQGGGWEAEVLVDVSLDFGVHAFVHA